MMWHCNENLVLESYTLIDLVTYLWTPNLFYVIVVTLFEAFSKHVMLRYLSPKVQTTYKHIFFVNQRFTLA